LMQRKKGFFVVTIFVSSKTINLFGDGTVGS